MAASTASGHLARLVGAGLVAMHPQGRHCYYRLAGPDVAELIETLARIAPAAPVTSLRQGTRAEALRSARTCYDHLAGRLGAALFTALLDQRLVTGGDGRHRLDTDGEDRLSAPGRDIDYRLTGDGWRGLSALGATLPPLAADGTLPVRYCVDWTEQRHHLSGAVGRGLTTRLLELEWITRAPRGRAVLVTPRGRERLAAELSVEVSGD